ncbi:hypothetical protein GGD63_008096 [Bradyrhizobium sp. cir1]|uniref:hypothetical protein n=1 Tax=Bradyrhizobium sp. cir1 TaxID=1445730 RepID=UPI00160691D6|nr:hypothetical protein [Bradyrhizobium sp. cir1]MBB4375247.1 hypothetical protein [Bradyrhizobium sp. cir1]
MASHELLGGLIQVYRRGDGRYWQCSASIDGKQYRKSTGAGSGARQAEDWYFGLRGKARAGLLKTEKTFDQVADQFEKEYEIITEGQRSARWTRGHKDRLRLHLRPFLSSAFRKLPPAGSRVSRPSRLAAYEARQASDPQHTA